MHFKRKALGAVVYNDYIYAIGGSHGSEYHASVERFDGRSWEVVTSLPAPIVACGAAVF